MPTQKLRQKRKGQFFTPEDVAQLAWDVLFSFAGQAISKRPRVVDPACGEGVFLMVGARCLGVDAEFLGVDTDSGLKERWASLGRKNKNVRIVAWNGLQNHPAHRFEPGAFDIVV